MLPSNARRSLGPDQTQDESEQLKATAAISDIHDFTTYLHDESALSMTARLEPCPSRSGKASLAIESIGRESSTSLGATPHPSGPWPTRDTEKPRKNDFVTLNSSRFKEQSRDAPSPSTQNSRGQKRHHSTGDAERIVAPEKRPKVGSSGQTDGTSEQSESAQNVQQNTTVCG